MYQLALLQIPMSSGKVEYEQLLVNKITFKEEVRMARIIRSPETNYFVK